MALLSGQSTRLPVHQRQDDRTPDRKLLFQFSSLPTEIVLLIFDHLPLPTQACLALICKSLYEDLGYILKDKSLSGPSLWACKTVEVPLSQPELLRPQFLSKIEDVRWLYCSGCLKIHPRDLFDQDQQYRSFETRRCRHDAGVVDVCLCLTLTYFEAQQLEQWLRTGHADTVVEKARLAFTPVILDNGWGLTHQCSITDHPDASVELAFRLSIGASNSLELRTVAIMCTWIMSFS